MDLLFYRWKSHSSATLCGTRLLCESFIVQNKKGYVSFANKTKTKINYAPILFHECDIMVGNPNKIIGMPFEEVDMHAYIVYFCN